MHLTLGLPKILGDFLFSPTDRDISSSQSVSDRSATHLPVRVTRTDNLQKYLNLILLRPFLDRTFGRGRRRSGGSGVGVLFEGRLLFGRRGRIGLVVRCGGGRWELRHSETFCCWSNLGWRGMSDRVSRVDQSSECTEGDIYAFANTASATRHNEPMANR